MKLKAVLFDMDGLITDSEACGHKILKEAAGRFGVTLTDEFLFSITGQNGERCIAAFHAFSPKLDGKEILDIYRTEMRALSRRGGIPLKPGVRELLDVLDAHHIPRAVASSNGSGMVEDYLRSYGILERFDALICGNMISRSKPAPDIYLAAAAALNVPPSNCLVLEDSPNGLMAGHAAGMFTCMVPDHIPYTEEMNAFTDEVRGSLTEVIPMIMPWLS